MNHELTESLNGLVRLSAAARERERTEEPLRSWHAAIAQLRAAREAREPSPELDRLAACLASLEWVVRGWRDCGFQASFRVAGDLLEAATREARPSPAPSRVWRAAPLRAQVAGP